MQGVLTVTEGGGGEDTTAPETSAKVEGDKDADGAYIGQATVTLAATDADSGVDTIEYAVGADGAWQPYTTPVVVNEVGAHKVRYRATDKSGNAAAEKSVDFTVAAPPTDDETPPETSATVSGEKDDAGAYLGMATVTVTASDTGSGVNTIEYAIGADGAWQAYTAPVMVHEVGTHKVRYRATDRSGNAAAEKSVDFTVVEPPSQDQTPPETSATVEGTRTRTAPSSPAPGPRSPPPTPTPVWTRPSTPSTGPLPRLHRTRHRRPGRLPHLRPPGDGQGGQHLRGEAGVVHHRRERWCPGAELPGVRRAAHRHRGHGRHGCSQPHHR
ncbi:hypothetical protein NKH18_44530 [Streptomyces sp. M10(2022)]